MKQGLGFTTRAIPAVIAGRHLKEFLEPFLSSNIISNTVSCTFAAFSSMRADMPDTVALDSDDTNGVDAKD